MPSAHCTVLMCHGTVSSRGQGGSPESRFSCQTTGTAANSGLPPCPRGETVTCVLPSGGAVLYLWPGAGSTFDALRVCLALGFHADIALFLHPLLLCAQYTVCARVRNRTSSMPCPSDMTLRARAAPTTAGQHAIFEFTSVRTPSGATSIASAGSRATASSPAAAAGTSLTRQWTVTSHPTAAVPITGINAPMPPASAVDGMQSESPMGMGNSSSDTSSSSGSGMRPGTFTISVKRAGLVSSHLHDNVRPGHVLALRGFAGDFTSQLLQEEEEEGHEVDGGKVQEGVAEEEEGRGVVVLMAGGIGITPLWAVIQDLVVAGGAAAVEGSRSSGGSGEGRRRRRRRVVLLYSVRHRAEAAFLGQLRRLAEEGGEALEAGGLELQVGWVVCGRVLSAARAACGDDACVCARWWSDLGGSGELCDSGGRAPAE